MFRCDICEELHHEVTLTTSEKLGGEKEGLPVTVCDYCMENIEKMKAESERSESNGTSNHNA